MASVPGWPVSHVTQAATNPAYGCWYRTMDNRTFATEVARTILDRDDVDGDNLIAIICSDNEFQQKAWVRLCRMKATRSELLQIVMHGKAAAEWAGLQLIDREDCTKEDLALLAARLPELRAVAWDRLLRQGVDTKTLEVILKQMLLANILK